MNSSFVNIETDHEIDDVTSHDPACLECYHYHYYFYYGFDIQWTH